MNNRDLLKQAQDHLAAAHISAHKAYKILKSLRCDYIAYGSVTEAKRSIQEAYGDVCDSLKHYQGKTE